MLIHWNATYDLRHASVQKTVSELIKDWPILKLNSTQELIEEDFIAQYSSQANALLVKWENCFNMFEYL
ncbi:hypothetical protein QE152_g8576 [Popillia japonica]|uniref:Uncharacterized protein n=1 Tax=Popillia japonica TaxID=7064 RepID=A0AAW1M0C3_POPJA